jgi:hypothetical protein
MDVKNVKMEHVLKTVVLVKVVLVISLERNVLPLVQIVKNVKKEHVLLSVVLAKNVELSIKEEQE